MPNKLFLLFVEITLLPHGKSTDTTATNLCFEGTIGCARGSCAVTGQYTSPYRDSTTASDIFDYQVSWDTERLRGTSELLSECIKACHLGNYFSGPVGSSAGEMPNKLFLLPFSSGAERQWLQFHRFPAAPRALFKRGALVAPASGRAALAGLASPPLQSVTGARCCAPHGLAAAQPSGASANSPARPVTAAMRVPVLVVVASAARLLLAAAVPATTTRTTRHELSNAIEDSLVHRRKDVAAVSRLLQVFGVREPRRRERHQQPPEYMLELYNATTGSGGITRSANPYNANLVRSFPDRGERFDTPPEVDGVYSSEKGPGGYSGGDGSRFEKGEEVAECTLTRLSSERGAKACAGSLLGLIPHPFRSG
ncbi:hypothetical protein HPB47_003213 [Ixodes persulcatus]|uniref:Uncharacterized protein n=1 Tax=Ixodes persulcatus TaxID=34615 RepID=A0AC60PJ19_IXOPE|nr:hypothetical protein HPB47_003213 [Ixodes persulcatus]